MDIVGFVIAYYMLIRAASELPLSRWSKNFSFLAKRNIIAYGYIIYGVLIFILGYSTQIWHLFAIQTIIGLIDALTYPIKWPIFSKSMDKGNEEFEWGLEDIGSTLLPGIFTAMAGVISVSFGLEAAFLLFAALMVISGIIFLFLTNETHRNSA